MDTVYNYIELIADTKSVINDCLRVFDGLCVFDGCDVEAIDARAQKIDIASIKEEIITYCHGHKKLMNSIIAEIKGLLESEDTDIVFSDEDWMQISTMRKRVSVSRLRLIIIRLGVIKEEILSTLDELQRPSINPVNTPDNPISNKKDESQLTDIHAGSNEDGLYLPIELDTERARKYFAKALDDGFMKKTDKGYEWIYGENKGQIRLGYFCSKVYPKEDYIQRPINVLEELFGVNKLSASISRAETMEPKRADVRKWLQEMDVFFAD